jgi:hypothetical protein
VNVPITLFLAIHQDESLGADLVWRQRLSERHRRRKVTGEQAAGEAARKRKGGMQFSIH